MLLLHCMVIAEFDSPVQMDDDALSLADFKVKNFLQQGQRLRQRQWKLAVAHNGWT